MKYNKYNIMKKINKEHKITRNDKKRHNTMQYNIIHIAKLERVKKYVFQEELK